MKTDKSFETCLRYCVGTWCEEPMDFFADVPPHPIDAYHRVESILPEVPLGKVLSVHLSISSAPEYILNYQGILGIFDVFDGIFSPEAVGELTFLKQMKVLFAFTTRDVQGYSIPLLTIRLDFFSEDEASLFAVKSHLGRISHSVCGVPVQTELKNFPDARELRAFLFHRMGRTDGYSTTRSVRNLLTKTDVLQWVYLIESGPILFEGCSLPFFRESCAGNALEQASIHLRGMFSTWGEI